jgi:hypothetical protein
MHSIHYSYTDIYGCSNTITKYVRVIDLPGISASATPKPVSYGNSATLDVSVSGSSTYSYLWSPADSLNNPGNAIMKSPDTKPLIKPTLFTVKVTDNNTGCYNTDKVNVSISGGPLNVTPFANADTVCPGDTTTIHAQATGGTGSYTYTWSSNPPGFSANTADPTVTVNTPTTFSVTVDDGSTTASDSVTISTWNLPNVNLSGLEKTYCKGDALDTLTGSPAGGIFSGSGMYGSFFYPDSVMPGISTVTYSYTDIHGCSAEDTDTTLVSDPLVNLGDDTTICYSSSITLSAGSAFSTYLWSTGETTQSITIDSTSHNMGTHQIVLTVIDTAGCSAVDTIQITLEDCSGINDSKQENNIIVYPNPTEGKFTIEINNSVNDQLDICIYNLTGNKILCKHLEYAGSQKQVHRFDLSNQPSGMYLLRITGNHTRKVRHIIIQ